METAYEIATDLYEAGVIDASTMREYEILTIDAVNDFSPKEKTVIST